MQNRFRDDVRLKCPESAFIFIIALWCMNMHKIFVLLAAVLLKSVRDSKNLSSVTDNFRECLREIEIFGEAVLPCS